MLHSEVNLSSVSSHAGKGIQPLALKLRADITQTGVSVNVFQICKNSKFSLIHCKFGVCFYFYVVVTAALIYLTKEQKDKGTSVLHVIRLKGFIETEDGKRWFGMRRLDTRE